MKYIEEEENHDNDVINFFLKKGKSGVLMCVICGLMISLMVLKRRFRNLEV